MPVPRSRFNNDAKVKTELIWHGPNLKPASVLVERRNALVRIRRNRESDVLSHHLQSSDSTFEMIADPVRAPEVMDLREQLRSWRFYDDFRTDRESPRVDTAPRCWHRTAAISPQRCKPSGRSATARHSNRR